MLAELIVNVFFIYLAIGVLFAIGFVTAGVGRMDHSAKGAGFGFRLLILPGAAALWPLLAWRWLRKLPPPVERNPHRDAAQTGKGKR